jgi:uncharacterized protein YndB with AHSA1/START domain
MTPNIIPASVDSKRKVTSGSRTIPASPEAIFEVLADPSKHTLIDGSGTVKGTRSSNPTRLSKGSKFGMDMKFGIPYRISNTVSEFTEPKLIEWHHPGRHRWRYELEPVEGGTRVTESFDWGKAVLPARAYELVGYPERHRNSIDATLQRLEQLFSAD